MAAGLIVPISGAYTGTYFFNLLGTMNDDGFILSGTWHGQEVNASDAYGMTLVEAVYRGLDWRLSFTALEFNQAGIASILNTFGGARVNDFSPILSNVGRLYSQYAGVLTLNAILGNPPTTPQTLTAASAVLAPEMNVPLLMTSKAREAPIEMVLLPYTVTVGTATLYNASFTTT